MAALLVVVLVWLAAVVSTLDEVVGHTAAVEVQLAVIGALSSVVVIQLAVDIAQLAVVAGWFVAAVDQIAM